jgi:hypothetical protein
VRGVAKGMPPTWEERPPVATPRNIRARGRPV